MFENGKTIISIRTVYVKCRCTHLAKMPRVIRGKTTSRSLRKMDVVADETLASVPRKQSSQGKPFQTPFKNSTKDSKNHSGNSLVFIISME